MYLFNQFGDWSMKIETFTMHLKWEHHVIMSWGCFHRKQTCKICRLLVASNQFFFVPYVSQLMVQRMTFVLSYRQAIDLFLRWQIRKFTLVHVIWRKTVPACDRCVKLKPLYIFIIELLRDFWLLYHSNIYIISYENNMKSNLVGCHSKGNN